MADFHQTFVNMYLGQMIRSLDEGTDNKRLKVKSCLSISELRSVTCHMAAQSQSFTCRPTQVNAPRLNPQSVDLPSPEGWKAELTLVRRLTCLQTVIHPSSNQRDRESNPRPFDRQSTNLPIPIPIFADNEAIYQWSYAYWLGAAAESVSDDVDEWSKLAAVVDIKLVLCSACCPMQFFVSRHRPRPDTSFKRRPNIMNVSVQLSVYIIQH